MFACDVRVRIQSDCVIDHGKSIMGNRSWKIDHGKSILENRSCHCTQLVEINAHVQLIIVLKGACNDTNKAKRNVCVLSGMAGHIYPVWNGSLLWAYTYTGVTFDVENGTPGSGSLRGHFEAALGLFLRLKA